MGGTGGREPPTGKLQNYKFLSNTHPDPLKNRKVSKPEFHVGPLSARQRNDFSGIWTGSSLFQLAKKRFGPPLTKLSGSKHENFSYRDSVLDHIDSFYILYQAWQIYQTFKIAC